MLLRLVWVLMGIWVMRFGAIRMRMGRLGMLSWVVCRWECIMSVTVEVEVPSPLRRSISRVSKLFPRAWYLARLAENCPSVFRTLSETPTRLDVVETA